MKKRSIEISSKFYLDNPWASSIQSNIDSIIQTIFEHVQNGAKILICGNGGSAADSNHIVGELMKGFELKRPIDDELHKSLKELYGEQGVNIASKLQKVIPAISLNQHSSLQTAIQNDTDPNMIYAQQVFGYGRKGDVLIGLSTSGNAQNVINAFKVGNAMDILTIGLTGNDGGNLKKVAKGLIIAPATRTYRIQEMHLAFYHYLCLWLESEFFEK